MYIIGGDKKRYTIADSLYVKDIKTNIYMIIKCNKNNIV